MKILITGSCGFIGFHLTNFFLTNTNFKIIGIDNINSYYSTKLKLDRLKILNKINNKNFKFYKTSINNKKKIESIFRKNKINVVVNLAAQAGVRKSLKEPEAYFDNNVYGFFNIIELVRKFKIKHLIFASTSSVYGNQKNSRLSECLILNPIQFYAATKIVNEIIAENYSKIYNMKITGLRFFTVYGPWGRPDMALFKFTSSILKNKSIELFNFGNHSRDFTFVDDIVDGIVKALNRKRGKLFEVYNLGRGRTEALSYMVRLIENNLEKKAKKKYLPMQFGDIISTSSDIKKAKNHFKYNPKISLKKGIPIFLKWFRNYNK